MNREGLKQALIAIAIGAAINIITVLSQFAIEWLRHIPPEIPGTALGMAKYINWLRKA